MRRVWLSLLGGVSALLISPSGAHAQSPQQVNNWNGGVSLPADVSMYAYVPGKVAAKPPLLTVIHYCGGSAQAVFNQAKGGGLVAAADKYGFILILPSNANAAGQNGRCWDVSSKKAQTRDGGGDTHAIAQMVKYALTQYHANADRVYCSGDSSGGMTTQLMLALYPDVYKAGSSFAGVPAGCSNAFDGAGLCGFGAQTAQQWGDRVRAMNPGYTGRRPRVQLFHGDADDTIKFPNHGESIKEWTNVLALAASPGTTDTGLSLGNHQATRQRWKNQCGFVTLDAFTSIGGDHGPSDALFEADYVVPFLGLDDTGEVDPEVKQCSGAGGSSGVGGTAGSAGSAAGGTTDAGGGAASGGSSNVAGSSSIGGSGSGGSNASAGAPGVAGNVASAGSPAGGASSVAGQGPTLSFDGDEATADTSGCTCQLGARSSNGGIWTAALALGIASARRRRRVA
jgi:poly(hydroxyalkanoate) depolymerase family esterase